jgi:hypothetical protein
MAKKKQIPGICKKVCPKCKADLTQNDSTFRTYTIPGHTSSTGEFKEDGSLDWDGLTKCSNCGNIIAHLN